jgi:hypothetical protein
LSNPVLTTTKAYDVVYPDRMGQFCHLEDISIEDMIRKIQIGAFLDSHPIKGNLLCFSYKIGLMDDYGEIKEKFIRGVLKRAADEVINICINDKDYLRLPDFMVCVYRNLPISLSML